MSKQLTLSAALSVIAMAAFALAGAPRTAPANETGAPSELAAPALEASLPTP